MSLLETAVLELRGLPARAMLRLGPVLLAVAPDGTASLRLSDEPQLACHLGLLAITVDGETVGEVDIRPAKLTDDRYRILRAELEDTWTSLVLDPGAPTALRATGPDARELWRRLGPPLLALEADPPRHLAGVDTVVRAHQLRSPSQFGPQALVAYTRGAPFPARAVGPVDSSAEHGLVVATLRRLSALAHRQPSAADVADEVDRRLGRARVHHLPRPTAPTYAMRRDRRLRAVLDVHRLLQRPIAQPTEGPGELRLGVKAIDKLYEYWVFLRTLRLVEAVQGPPLAPGYQMLATRLAGDTLRLELEAGTTVAFPGGVLVAYEPLISTDPHRSWRALELAPNPHEAFRAQQFVTPDIVVLVPGPHGVRVVVVDAKYRARHAVDRAAVDVHARYGRLRHDGAGVVERTVIAHPHDLDLRFAGYAAVPFIPGEHCERWWLDELVGREPATAAPAARAEPPPAPGPPRESQPNRPLAPPTPPVPTGRLVIVADQTWMRQHLGSRRIDLARLARTLAGDRAFTAYVVMPAIPVLEPFALAAERRGWKVVETPTVDREPQLAEAARIAAGTDDQDVVVVSGDPAFLAAVTRARGRTPYVDDLTFLPDLG